jgi:predicted alpha/beta hydrolase family esterase
MPGTQFQRKYIASARVHDGNCWLPFISACRPRSGGQTLPVEPLAFPTILIASRDDKYSSFADSAALAKVLGAKLVDAGFSGHINSENGHRPWPEGLMSFARFIKTL